MQAGRFGMAALDLPPAPASGGSGFLRGLAQPPQLVACTTMVAVVSCADAVACFDNR